MLETILIALLPLSLSLMANTNIAKRKATAGADMKIERLDAALKPLASRHA